MTKKQNKLGAYLAVTAGVGCVASVAEGAVTFYGVNSANDTNPDPSGIAVGILFGKYGLADTNESNASYFAGASGTILFFDGSSDPTITEWQLGGFYSFFGTIVNGASIGDQNYANISFDGNDGVYEAVGQFYLDGAGGGYLIAIATNDAPNAADALSISAGKAMIDAAAVPEPSSLSLLALGATGLLARRRRKTA